MYRLPLHSLAALVTLVQLIGWTPHRVVAASPDDEAQFEKQVRPLLVERCHKCHAGNSAKGGLRVDSREALLRGGESGPAILPGKPDESLLVQAVRQQNGLAMPPDGKLNEMQIMALVQWIKAGAAWPGTPAAPPAAPNLANVTVPLTSIMPAPPNTGELARGLQLWLKADALTVADGEPVHVWPDASGRGRDVSATKGVRAGGVGLPGRFVRESMLVKRPAVRFETTTGFASSPDLPVDLRGDAALTITLVMNLRPHEALPPYDGVIGIGNPAHGGNPGKPLAALVQINRGENHALHFAGGWNHDASLGAGSFQPLYSKPVLLSVVKRPGPMKSTTRIFVDGVEAGKPGQPLEGVDGVPDIQHRTDIGVYLGKALDWCGSIQGDVGEVIVFNQALSDEQRLNTECYLAEKFGLVFKPLAAAAAQATFKPEEKQFWAYQPVRRATPPAVNRSELLRSPIDLFVERQRKTHNDQLAPPADKRTLLRRLAFDLTGLPPSIDMMREFLDDDAPDATARIVDRLLASHHHGERWARHWLDVVRYAESTANDANAVMRFAWRYRNYVIDAFNHDLPYNQFLIEQLAGDLLLSRDSDEQTARRVTATGYLMVGPKALAETDKEQSRLDIVDDQIDVTGRAMLGLTLACARCHDHKFDAIRATDYYALAGIFRSTEPFENEVRNASMWWEYPVNAGLGREPITVMAPKETMPRNLRVHLRGNRFTLGTTVPRGMLQIINECTPAMLPLNSQSNSLAIDPQQLSSGRLELAHWITHPANPLTPRVWVNRIWQHHFGTGIVATSDNFGTRGARPTDPELLDWLATRLLDTGWSSKMLHRELVLSGSYAQRRGADHRATADGSPLVADAVLRRLSAEELRDAILAVSGQLDRNMGTSESGEFLYEKAENIGAKIRPNRVTADDPYYSQFAKRTIYLPVVRNMLPDVLSLFDAADPNGVTTERNETTVASQSLFLLNSPFVREQAMRMAERLLASEASEAGVEIDRIKQLHAEVFHRAATAEELADAQAFLAAFRDAPVSQARPRVERERAAWQALCQTLLCSNEFLYVD